MESPYIPSSESAHSGRSCSPEHPGERVADSSVRQIPNALAMQYVNHANVPTSTGYAYAEHNRSELRGVTDVDVDEKTNMVYESMTEVQHLARQRMINGGNDYTTRVEAGNGPANTQGEKSRRDAVCGGTTCLLVKIIWNMFLFVVVVGAFVLAVYNFLGRNMSSSVAPLTTDAPGTTSQMNIDNSALAQLQDLNETINQLRAQLNQIHADHDERYNSLNASIISAIQSVQNVNANNELDLYMGCREEVIQCIVDHTEARPTPSSAECTTAPKPLTVADMTNTDIYCSVDNAVGETNPIVSSLNIYNGQIRCVCNLIALANPIGDPICELHINRCPNTIRLNTSSTP